MKAYCVVVPAPCVCVSRCTCDRGMLERQALVVEAAVEAPSVLFCQGLNAVSMLIREPARRGLAGCSGPLWRRTSAGSPWTLARRVASSTHSADAAGDLDRHVPTRPLVDDRQALHFGLLAQWPRTAHKVDRPDVIAAARGRRTRQSRPTCRASGAPVVDA